MNTVTSYLPHRPPFLFVDEVEIVGEKIKAKKIFNPDEWFFKGHFPAFPVVPGVLLIEAMAQAGGVGVKLLGVKPDSMFVFAKIRSATFRQPVLPGNTLEMEIENVKIGAFIIHQKGLGKVDGRIAVEAEWIAMASGVPE